MQGIDIIIQEQLYEYNPAWIIVGFVGALILAFVLAWIYGNYNLHPIIVVIVPIIFELCFVFCGTMLSAKPTGRYTYTAWIAESVSMIEFYDNYTNISVDKYGLYHFEDKEVEESN